MDSGKKLDNFLIDEMSKTSIRNTKNMTKEDDKSLTIIISDSDKVRGRSSDVPKVVFADEKVKVEVSPTEEAVKESKENSVSNTDLSISPLEEEEEPLDINTHDNLRELQVRTKKHLESQPELSRPSSDLLINDEFVVPNDRESIRRSFKFRRETTEGMISPYPQIPRPGVYRQDNDESISVSTATENSPARTSEIRTRFSGTVAVRSISSDISQVDFLNPLEARAFAIVLQESLDLLAILEHVIPAKVDERWDESYKTIDEKYGTPEKLNVMFREDMGLLPLIPTTSEKIQRDRTYAYHVLKGTVRDIQCLRRYDRLETEVDDIARILEGENNLENNNEMWLNQVEQLRELIESDRMENEEDIKNLLVSAQKMNAEVDNAIFSNKLKLEYVQRWEETRLDQQKLCLEIAEQNINDALENCSTSERADQIISGEVRNFLQANTADLEKNIMTWTSRYSEEIERLQREINDTKEKIEFQKLDIQNLEYLRNDRQNFLDDCYKKKELAEEEIEYWDAVNNAATLIQSLWRGYMVRHQLGRFKTLFATIKKKKDKKMKKAKSRKKKKK